MRVAIAGVDGFIGWPLAQSLTAGGHDVYGFDSLARRDWVREVGSVSAIPIASSEARQTAFRDRFGTSLPVFLGDLRDGEQVARWIAATKPDAVVHLGECPSAPYSMIDLAHATYVQTNNVVGTLNILYALRDHAPHAHLVKLGTMGEYGTPQIDIPEGFFDVEYRGRRDRLPFPRQAGSWYHWSKVHGSNNVMFACQLWDLRATDVMQGIVYGRRFGARADDARLTTRLDFDHAFGTVVHRFCCEAAIGHPLTVYGTGEQRRAFLPLVDVITCLTLILQNPPSIKEYRVVNQFGTVHSVREIAQAVSDVGASLGLHVNCESVPNPRAEAEDHYYAPDRSLLDQFGYRPEPRLRDVVEELLVDLEPHVERIRAFKHAFRPKIRWRTASGADGKRATTNSFENRVQTVSD